MVINRSNAELVSLSPDNMEAMAVDVKQQAETVPKVSQLVES